MHPVGHADRGSWITTKMHNVCIYVHLGSQTWFPSPQLTSCACQHEFDGSMVDSSFAITAGVKFKSGSWMHGCTHFPNPEYRLTANNPCRTSINIANGIVVVAVLVAMAKASEGTKGDSLGVSSALATVVLLKPKKKTNF